MTTTTATPHGATVGSTTGGANGMYPVRYARGSGPRKPTTGEEAYTMRERALQRAAREDAATAEAAGEAATSKAMSNGNLIGAPPTKAGRETHLGRRIRFLSFLQGVKGPTALSVRMYGKKTNMGNLCSIMTGRQDNVTIPMMKRIAKALGVPLGLLVSGNIGAVRTDHFGQRLRAYREMERLSLRDVGKRGEMSFNTVSKWEQAAHAPYEERLLAFSVALDVPLDELQAYAKLAPPAPAGMNVPPPSVFVTQRQGHNNLAEYNRRVTRAGLKRFPPPTKEVLEAAERKVAEFNAKHHEDTWRRQHEAATGGTAGEAATPMKTDRTEEVGRTKIDDRQAVSAMSALFQHAVDEGKTITITINPK